MPLNAFVSRRRRQTTSGQLSRPSFCEGQIVWVNPAFFKRRKHRLRNMILKYIEEIEGPILRLKFFGYHSNLNVTRDWRGRFNRFLRIPQESEESQEHHHNKRTIDMHILDATLNVPLIGNGPLHTLKIIVYFEDPNCKGQGVKKGDVCYRGGTQCDKTCNWCGSISIGHNVDDETRSLRSHSECFRREYV